MIQANQYLLIYISFELFDSTGIEDTNIVNSFRNDKFGNPLRYKVIVNKNNVTSSDNSNFI